jgi:hypothetical protein
VNTGQTVVESFLGLGVQWDPYEYVPSPASWKLTLKRIDFHQPAFVRVMGGAGDYCLGFSLDGKPEYIREKGIQTLRGEFDLRGLTDLLIVGPDNSG